MWNRKELKKKGKILFKRNYVKCVIVSLILTICLGVNNTGGNFNYSNVINEDYYNRTVNFGNLGLSVNTQTSQKSLSYGYLKFADVTIAFIMIAIIISLLISIFIFNVIEVGGSLFFIRNSEDSGSVKDILECFDNENYRNIVYVQFRKNLEIFLWTLLFIIPGIIKSYEYMMIRYIIAEDPQLSYDEAKKLSKEMMNGNKFNAFVLNLSFLGWELLSALTFGILGYLYVNPYVYATETELYNTLKRNQNMIEMNEEVE
jgi:uncharacterized membrane protein